jgi:uncharacterized protein YdeI (BOF family)
MRLRMLASRGVVTVAAAVICMVGLMVGTALAVVADIGSVLADPAAYKDQWVTITGTIDQVVDGNEFIFKDATGTIQIDGGPSWYKDLAVAGVVVGGTYTITGEVDLGKDGTAAAEVDIHTVADDTGATIATVREGTGRPGWAGGPNKNAQNPGQSVVDDDVDAPGQGKPDTAGKPEIEDDLDTDSD